MQVMGERLERETDASQDRMHSCLARKNGLKELKKRKGRKQKQGLVKAKT